MPGCARGIILVATMKCNIDTLMPGCVVAIVIAALSYVWFGSSRVKNPTTWPPSVYRRVRVSGDQLLYDSQTGKFLFTYDSEKGYSVKEIKKVTDGFVVTFVMIDPAKEKGE